MKSRRNYAKTACMSNFSLGFAYEIFFEVCLCTMIHMATAWSGSAFFYSLSLLFVIAILAFVALLFALFCKHGPYTQPNSFAPNSLRKSWWGTRHLWTDTADICVDSNNTKFKEKEYTERALLNFVEAQPI